MDDLNKEQQEAVTYTNGPLLVLAGAGSGKTKVLTQRVAHFIKSGSVELFSPHFYQQGCK